MSKEKLFSLYKITNTVNGKIYIGQTVAPSARWRDHRNASVNPKVPLHFALKKYGTHNFEFEVIAQCKTQDDANELETLLVSQYESYISTGKGYNATYGGMNAPKTEEWKQMMSEKTKQRFADNPEYKEQLVKASADWKEEHKNELSDLFGHKTGSEQLTKLQEAAWQANTGRKQSEEQIQKRVEGVKKYLETHEHWHKGKKLSEEHKTVFKRTGPISESHKKALLEGGEKTRFQKGMVPWNKKLTEQQEHEIMFKYQTGQSQRSLALEYNIDRSSIKRIINQ